MRMCRDLRCILIILVVFCVTPNTLAQSASTAELYVETGHTEKIVVHGFDITGEILITLSGRVGDGLEPDGKLPGWRGVAKIWDLSTATQVRSVDIPSNFDTTVHLLPQHVSLRNNLLGIWFSDEIVRTFDIVKKKEIDRNTVPADVLEAMGPTLVESEGRVKVDIQADPIFIATSSISSCRMPDGSAVIFEASANNSENYRYRIRISIPARTSRESFLGSNTIPVGNLVAANESRIITTAGVENELLNIWDLTGTNVDLRVLENEIRITAVAATQDLKFVAAGGQSIRIWDTGTGRIQGDLKGHTGDVRDLRFSRNGQFLVSFASDDRVIVWNLETMSMVKQIDCVPKEYQGAVAIDEKGERFATAGETRLTVWDVGSGRKIRELETELPFVYRERGIQFSEDTGSNPDARKVRFFEWPAQQLLLNDGLRVSKGTNDELIITDVIDKKAIARLVSPEKGVAIVTTPDGRFDTNKSLDGIKGLHWIVNDEILKPVPLEAFMRHYYEPNLLPRVMKCNRENTCDKEFKPLPPIGAINRVQPRVAPTL